MSKLSYKTLLIILFFLLIGVIVLWKFVLPNHKVEASWWNDGWNYRVAVNIGNTGSSLTNFQIPISVGTSALINSSKMQSDCDDIRVVDQNGNLLTYWVSGCGTTSTQIWPKIPSIPNGGATVYVYYGNPSATSVKSTVGTSDYPGLSCKSILDAGNSTGNNTYWIDPTNGNISDKFQAYCDMTNDSGGWMLVTQSMISSEVGTSVTTTKTTNINGGVDISNSITHSGCGASIYHRVLFTDIIPWTKIKADYEFLGGNSCWSIFGNTSYTGGSTNLIAFSSGTDTIHNQVKMGGSNGDNYDGINSRCDNETFNFWHSNQGVGTTRSAQVILRRNSMSSLAGLGTGAACSTAGYPWKYKNIYVREDVMTFAATAGTPATEEVGGGPIAYWKFDEGTGTTAYDSTTNQNNGIFSTGSSAPTWQIEDQCISGKCLSFNNVMGNKISSNFRYDNNQYFTISAFIKPTSTSSFKIIAGTAIGNNINSGLTLNVNNLCFHDYSTFSGDREICSSNNPIQLNTWQHIALIYSNGSLELFVNGKSVKTGSFTITSSGNTTLIGGSSAFDYSGGRFFSGFIDDIKIYPYARTADQIKLDYNSRGSSNGSSVNLGVQSSTAPDLNSKLIGYYKFDEGNGNNINNTKSTSYDGTKYNTTNWDNNGKYNKALWFDGTTAQLIINNTSGWRNNGNDMSLSIWIKPDSSDDGGYIFSKPWNGSGGYNYGLTSSGGANPSFSFTLTGASSFSLGSNKTVSSNQWHQIIITVNNTTKLVKFYIDGKITNSNTHTITDWTPSGGDVSVNFVLGCIYPYASNSCAGATTYDFKGYMDEFKYYNTVLTDEEVKQDYNQGSAISFGSTNQTIGGTTTSLEYCIPGDTSTCLAPVAEWKMDEKTGITVKDTSGNNNNGTITGATWTTGQIGAGLKFSGSGQAVSVVDNSTLKPTAAITTEAWFNTIDKTVTSQRILSKTEGSGYQLSINENSACPSSTLCFLININGTYYSATYASSNLSNNTWYHIAGSYDGTTVKLFLNGSNIGTTATISNTITQAAYNLCIGSETDAGSCTSGFFNGKIDHVKIYDYARTPAQIAYDYNKGAPVGWWKLDDCQGLTAFDSSGLGNNGAISIGPSGTQNSAGTCQIGTSAAWTNGATGKINSSLNFDGNDDYISTSYISGIQSFITISAWIKPNALTSTYEISNQGQWDGGPWTGWRFRQINNYINFKLGDNTSNAYEASGGTLIQNSWQHVVGIWDGSYIRLYINGKEVVKTAKSFTYVGNTGSHSIGKYGGSAYFFKGQIDDLRIYNYALTPEQVKTVFNNGAVNFQ
ncbi:MAG: DUF2341 domain-containing protein [Candidatus Shapirobacteria bacterium]